MLGTLEVSADGELLPLAGRKQRTLLAALLMARNSVVARDVLIDAVWGERPPPSAAESLDTYVYRLRKLLGHDRVVRETGGYRLRVEPGELDADEFERLVSCARASGAADDLAAAAGQFGAALKLWRGPLSDEVLDGADLGGQAQRLEELRLSALESRIDAMLALGAGADLVAELEQLLNEHSHRERLLRGLMLALYRSGRQTEALEVFRTARAQLVEQFGLEPSPELYDLQRRILRHDPALHVAPQRRSPKSPLPSSPPARRSRLLSAVLAVLSASAAGVLLVATGVLGSASAGVRAAPLAGSNGIVSIGMRSAELTTTLTLSGAPAAVAAGDGAVWAADAGSDVVSQIDPRSGEQVQRLSVGGDPASIVTGGGAVWVASSVAATVTRIDPATESITQRISLPGDSLGAIAYGDGSLWVADAVKDELFELSPQTGALTHKVALDLQPSAIIAARGAVWVAGYNSATVEKLASATGRVLARIRVGDGRTALAMADGSLWVANSLDATVSRIDPATRATVATIPVGSGPAALASDSAGVWVADQYSATVALIDERHDRVASTVAIGGAPTTLTATDGQIWAGVAAADAGHRGGTLTILESGPITDTAVRSNTTVDPAFYNVAPNPQFTGLAYDALVTFQQSPGAAGLRLVPDLALALPTHTDGGRLFVFRVRPGIRYSDGQPLRASDFRRGVERLFRVGSLGTTLFDAVLGASACRRTPATCDLARGIVTDDVTGTVVFHLATPDPEFLFNLTEDAYGAPIPPATPDREPGTRTVPGTGPYEIATVSNTEIRFVRNPYFHEWSHAAQPAGNPDMIIWRSVASNAAAVTAIEHGEGDWLSGQLPSSQYERLAVEDPAIVHSNPQFAVDFAPLNTHRAPFDDVGVRQALNYAIDRATLVDLYGGPGIAAPICQPIAPGLPGYRDYCPYTVNPDSSGRWSGPDLARARRLIAASHTAGEHIDLWGSPTTGYVPAGVPQYFAKVLRELGYHVRVHILPFPEITPAMWRGFQISTDGDWVANYPDPASYLPLFFACNGGNSNGYFCEPSIDREMDRAELLSLTDPSAAQKTWQRVDRQLTDAAEWVPTVTYRDLEISSQRVGNYEFNPVWGFLPDQAWVR